MISPRIVMISPMNSNFWDPQNGFFHRERCKIVMAIFYPIFIETVKLFHSAIQSFRFGRSLKIKCYLYISWDSPIGTLL